MKIPRPKAPEVPFKRRRAPPPQATKLLLASLGAALVFMAALAIVFIPPYLEHANAPPVVLLTLRLDTSGSQPRIVVVNVTPEGPLSTPGLPLADFNATLLRGNATVASLPWGLGNGTTALSFMDANGDGYLDVGDYFPLTATAQGSYVFLVYQSYLPDDRIAGRLPWTGALA